MDPISAGRTRGAGIYGLRLLRDPLVRSNALLVALFVVLAFRVIQFVGFTTQIQWGYDFSAYWQASRNILDGLPIYAADQLEGPYAPQRQFLYLYPPSLATGLTPLAALFPESYRDAAWIWAGLGMTIVAGVVLGVGQVERLFDPDRFGGFFAGRRRWLAVGAALTLPPVIGELVLGNVHLILLGLFAVAWGGIRRGTVRGEHVAGMAIGIAAVLKVFPAVVILWFALTGRHVAARWAAAGAMLAVALALPFTGIEPWLQYPTVLANLSASTDTTDTLAPTAWLAPLLGFTGARITVTVLALITVGLASRRPPAIGFGATVIASLLIAPAMYHHYLAILILPFLLAAASAKGRAWWLFAAYLALWGGMQPALGDLAWVVNRAMPTAGVLVLLGVFLAGSRPAGRASSARAT